MRAICVDDETIALKSIVQDLEEIEEITDVKGFNNAYDCIEYLKEHDADVGFLDIRMGDINGIELAKKIKKLRPNVRIIFLTGYEDYALPAMKLHASGYLLKPASVEDIKEELRHLRQVPQPIEVKKVEVHTFGNFAVSVDGKPVIFSRNKSKEILAYLIDRKGASIKLSELAGILWDDEKIYDRSRQKQMQVFIYELVKSLKEYGIEDIIVRHRTGIMVDKTKFKCDYYDYLDGDMDAINSYSGEYMSNYSWGEVTAAYLNKKK